MSEAPPPFVVFTAPRSRSFWASKFLSYGGWLVSHDEIMHLRSLEDLRSWLAMPGAGTVETSAAAFWRTLVEMRPDCRIATIRRDPEASLKSVMRVVPDLDLAATRKMLRHQNAKLDQIEARMPDVCRVTFDDLATEQGCARLFEHCLPFRFDPAWWAGYAPLNLQCNIMALQRYYFAHAKQLAKLTAQVKHLTLRGMAPRSTAERGIVLTVEPYTEALCCEAVPLLKDHMALMDLDPNDWSKRPTATYQRLQDLGALQCVVARINGRMFGYLVSIIAPSFDVAGRTEALHTIFFADKSVFGLGMQMQRFAAEQLKARGVDELIMRTGNRTASSPKLGTMYERMGAVRVAAMYRLPLGEAA